LSVKDVTTALIKTPNTIGIVIVTAIMVPPIVISYVLRKEAATSSGPNSVSKSDVKPAISPIQNTLNDIADCGGMLTPYSILKS